MNIFLGNLRSQKNMRCLNSATQEMRKIRKIILQTSKLCLLEMSLNAVLQKDYKENQCTAGKTNKVRDMVGEQWMWFQRLKGLIKILLSSSLVLDIWNSNHKSPTHGIKNVENKIMMWGWFDFYGIPSNLTTGTFKYFI